MSDLSSSHPEQPKPGSSGDSPYSTGGGGVTFERRVAATYLARLLTGDTAVELHGRRVQRVSFQQAPAHRVDDLLITAARDDGSGTLELEVAVRRAPAFTSSDKDTEKLIGDLLSAVLRQPEEDKEQRPAICVAGPQTAAKQVSQLADLAKRQATAQGFYSLVQTPGRFKQATRDRLDHLVNLVTANLSATGTDASPEAAQAATWQLLSGVEVLMPRLESPDGADWGELLNQLGPWAREPTVAAAKALRDRLESLAASYAPSAADIDLATLRRDTNEVLDFERRRRRVAWKELRRLDADARSAVRTTLGVGATPDPVHLPRPGLASKVGRELLTGGGVLVSGESGVGKSVLVLSKLADAAAADPAMCDVVFLNLRLLPPTMIELRNALGAPLEELLAEMSAPTRVLVLDAADVTIERDDQLLAQLLRASLAADVSPWVITATDGRAAVRAVMEEVVGSLRELTIDGLEDSELEAVEKTFPLLRRLLNEPRAKELLRRPGIIDLFVRSGSHGLPLSDADAFDIIWSQLVRSEARTARGLPDARDLAMRHLAAQHLRGTSAESTYSALDPNAVAGLQHDALLRPVDRWQPLPTFAHDLLRTYAVARVLLSVDDPVGELIENAAPRWTLPAMRLVLQVRLSAPDTPETPVTDRLAHLQAAMDRLPAAGHGERWADLPTEALLLVPNAREILTDAWPALVRDEASGLRRVLRLIRQRHSRGGISDRLVAEPVVALLLESEGPAGLSKEREELLCAWLRSLILVGEPRGHRLRTVLRERLVARVAAGDERLAEFRRREEERLAARTPEEIAQEEARARELQPLTVPFGRARRRRERRELPSELTNELLLEQLALLGADLGGDGEMLLRRVAGDAPHCLAPAVESLLTGHGLASYDTKLLTQLVEAYYIDEHDDGYGGIGDDGIRDHKYLGLAVPLSASYRGPFLAMFRADLRSGVACLIRLLNHAARARVLTLQDLSGNDAPEPEGRYVMELGITGERRRYVGDDHVWKWYRGTGVGPYPCMSALQALELVCDEHLKAGARLEPLVRLLLHGCENLAMPGLVVGMLVRHLERVESEIDPFLAEPMIWGLEFDRKGQEYSGLAAQTEGIVAPERRTWDLRDVATRLTLIAPVERRDALKAIGSRLVERAAEKLSRRVDEEPLSEELAIVRNWASSLDPEHLKLTRTDDGVLVENVPDEEVVARLASSNADLARGQIATGLILRYPERYSHSAKRAPVILDELLADLAQARDLADDPPVAVPFERYDAPAAVAAAALEARFCEGLDVPEDDLVWAAALLIGLVNELADQDASDADFSVFGLGADRSAARGLPLLWLPLAGNLRKRLAEEGVDEEAIGRGIEWMVQHSANETRLFLARGFDLLWQTPCNTSTGRCHHLAALAVIEDIARDCLFGPWDPVRQRRSRGKIDGPVALRLEDADDDHVDVPRLTAAIRGAGAAAASPACCRTDAAALLAAALAAHRRGMRRHEHGYHHSSNDAAAAARAVLEITASGDNSLLVAHVNDYADNSRLLSEFLRALTAAGEETQRRATAARDVWPAVLERVVEFVASGACPRDDDRYSQASLAAAIPSPSYEGGYLHREFEAEPILWPDPEALAPQIERWLPLAAGYQKPLDALAHLLDRLPAEQQAHLGLPWIEQLVMANPEQIANRSYMLPEWLERVQPHAASKPLREAWHRIVDALAVAGDTRIARLAD